MVTKYDNCSSIYIINENKNSREIVEEMIENIYKFKD
jgi:hypothetical protein